LFLAGGRKTQTQPDRQTDVMKLAVALPRVLWPRRKTECFY